MDISEDAYGALRRRGELLGFLCSGFLLPSLLRWGWFRFLQCWMIPFPATGYARRKPNTGNRSVRFDEEREVERPLFYSTIEPHLLLNKYRTTSTPMTVIIPNPGVLGVTGIADPAAGSTFRSAVAFVISISGTSTAPFPNKRSDSV